MAEQKQSIQPNTKVLAQFIRDLSFENILAINDIFGKQTGNSIWNSRSCDLDKLERVLDITMQIESDGTYYISSFRKCKISDFTGRGLTIKKEDENDYLNRLCPDMEAIKPFLRIEN